MKTEIPALTGIRALASWWVVFYHLLPTFAILAPSVTSVPWIAGIGKAGDKGVDLFFILSGFVLSLNYYDRFRQLNGESYGRFLWLRLARIYPVHIAGLLVWLAFAVMNVFVQHKDTGDYFSLTTLIANLLLIQSWSIPIKMSWNYPAWSISMEWLAYLCFPFVIRKVAGLKSTVFTVGLALLLLSVVAPLVIHYTAGEHLFRIGGEFVAGCLLWALYRKFKGTTAKRLEWTTLPSIAMAILLASTIGWYSIPAFGLVVLALSLDHGIGARIFASAPMVYWGKVSYSLYIMHTAMISACHVMFPNSKYQAASVLVRYSVMVIYLAFVAAAGMLTYHFVEEPMRLWLRDRGLKRRLSSEVGTPEPLYSPEWISASRIWRFIKIRIPISFGSQ